MEVSSELEVGRSIIELDVVWEQTHAHLEMLHACMLLFGLIGWN